MKILCVLYDDPKDGIPKNYPLSYLFALNFLFFQKTVFFTAIASIKNHNNSALLW